MDNKIKIKFNIMALILITIFAICVTPVSLQNDTFYSIKIGEYILENGITMQDPFSWHEELPYTYPHWAYDVATYLIYSAGGYMRNLRCNGCFSGYSGHIDLLCEYNSYKK